MTTSADPAPDFCLFLAERRNLTPEQAAELLETWLRDYQPERHARLRKAGTAAWSEEEPLQRGMVAALPRG